MRFRFDKVIIFVAWLLLATSLEVSLQTVAIVVLGTHGHLQYMHLEGALMLLYACFNALSAITLLMFVYRKWGVATHVFAWRLVIVLFALSEVGTIGYWAWEINLGYTAIETFTVWQLDWPIHLIALSVGLVYIWKRRP